MGQLLNYAEEIAKSNGFSNVYVSTDQEGIYEKYGFSFLKIAKDVRDEESRVYVKIL